MSPLYNFVKTGRVAETNTACDGKRRNREISSKKKKKNKINLQKLILTKISDLPNREFK